jgi:hypothetical protein
MIRKMTKQEQLNHMIKIFSNISIEELQVTQDALKHVLEQKQAQATLRQHSSDDVKFMVVDQDVLKIMQ